MKIKSIILSFLIFTYVQASENSLNDLIDIALENNTNISISKLKAQNKKATIGVSKSAYLPNLTAVGEVANYNLDNSSVDNSGQVESITLSASQLLYDFGKTMGSIAASKEDFEASINEIITTSSSTVLNVKNAYYNILNQHRLIEVAKESVKIDELQLIQATEFFKAGVKTKIDVTNAQLQLSNSNLQLLKSTYDLKSAKTKFITILGKEDIRESFKIKKENKNINNLSKDILQKETFILDNLIDEAFNNRAELLVQKSLINFQREQYISTKGDYFPTISLKGNYKDSNADSDISVLDKTEYSAGVYLEWNFFSGFKTKSNAKQKLTLLKTAKENLKFQELSIIEEVTTSYYNVQQSIDSLEISILNVQLANQNLELAQARYINGLNDIVELNDAKLDFIEAKNELVNTYYNYKTDLASLDYATGVIYSIKK